MVGHKSTGNLDISACLSDNLLTNSISGMLLKLLQSAWTHLISTPALSFHAIYSSDLISIKDIDTDACTVLCSVFPTLQGQRRNILSADPSLSLKATREFLPSSS